MKKILFVLLAEIIFSCNKKSTQPIANNTATNNTQQQRTIRIKLQVSYPDTGMYFSINGIKTNINITDFVGQSFVDSISTTYVGDIVSVRYKNKYINSGDIELIQYLWPGNPNWFNGKSQIMMVKDTIMNWTVL